MTGLAMFSLSVSDLAELQVVNVELMECYNAVQAVIADQ
jgi:hypothetical protein